MFENKKYIYDVASCITLQQSIFHILLLGLYIYSF